MTVEDEEVQTLKRLGLTVCQARIYLALAKLGSSTSKTVSQVSNVGREDIYRVMPILQELGLVEKLVKSPTEFRAIPMQIGLRALVKQKKKEYTELRAKTEQLLSDFKNKRAKTHQSEENQFVLIPRGKAVMMSRGKAIEKTQTSLNIIHSWKIHLQCENSVFDVAPFTELAKKALKRGAKIRVIVNKPYNSEITKTAATFMRKPHFELQFISTTPLAFIAIHDNKEVFLTTSSNGHLEDSPALWSNNPALLKILTDYFETMWLAAIKEVPEEHYPSHILPTCT